MFGFIIGVIVGAIAGGATAFLVANNNIKKLKAIIAAGKGVISTVTGK